MKKKKAKVAVETLESKVEAISKEVAVIQKKAVSLSVTNAEDYAGATEFLGGIKGRLKRIEELRLFFVKPIKDHAKEIDLMFAKQSEPLEKVERKVKRAMADYTLEQNRIAAKEEARLAALRAKQDERREEKGLPQILTPVPTVARPKATVKTEGGKSTARMVWKFRTINIDLVPREYLRCEVKYSEVQAAITTGVREIAGLEIYQDVDVSASAR